MNAVGLFLDIVGFSILFFLVSFKKEFDSLNSIEVHDGIQGGIKGHQKPNSVPYGWARLAYVLIVFGFLLQFLVAVGVSV